jgi:DNA-binding response OmpR family regulator
MAPPESSSARPRLRQRSSITSSKPDVLVVDDDPAICDLIRLTLEEDHIPVATAETGGQALQQAAAIRPKLVVLDMMLPDVDGLVVAAELHRRYGSRVRILVISASQQAGEWAHHAGAFSYLEKPFELDHLRVAVRRGLAA